MLVEDSERAIFLGSSSLKFSQSRFNDDPFWGVRGREASSGGSGGVCSLGWMLVLLKGRNGTGRNNGSSLGEPVMFTRRFKLGQSI